MKEHFWECTALMRFVSLMNYLRMKAIDFQFRHINWVCTRSIFYEFKVPIFPFLHNSTEFLNFLDEDHQTVIYKLSDRSAKIRNIIDVSDDFFELTIEDAKSILRDARKAQKEADPEAGGKTLMTKGKSFYLFFHYIPFRFWVKKFHFVFQKVKNFVNFLSVYVYS